jgi:hypothetical protein
MNMQPMVYMTFKILVGPASPMLQELFVARAENPNFAPGI